jgi:hypothetical protein
MNKRTITAILIFCSRTAMASETYYAAEGFPYAPAADVPGTTAAHMDSPDFVAWADGYASYEPGTHLAPQWMVPTKALAKAEGQIGEVVSLGRGGRITLTFSGGISDGPGADFAVFENAFTDSFLELAYVEVSSDGTNFTRFPGYSWSTAEDGAAENIDPTLVTGLAGKYRQAYGTPFDLDDLRRAYAAQLAGNTDFTNSYVSALTNTYPLLDLSHVSHVRVVDIVGDGSAMDAGGFAVFDPYPSSVSAGFDLDAIGVIHQPVSAGLPQTVIFDPVPHQRLVFQEVELNAVAGSGLPVFFAIQSGPAENVGNLLTFTGTGTVEVVASQPGDAVYAPAIPVLRSFRVAEAIQHIFVEPVPNQFQSGGAVQVNAFSSSGLPVRMEVYDGPFSVSIGETNHVLSLGNEAGFVTLRAYQPGTAAVAPADDVFVDFNIVAGSATNAPILFDDWLASNPVPNPSILSGTDVYGRPSVELDYSIDRRMLARSRVIESMDLAVWSNAIPRIVEWNGGSSMIQLKVQLTAEDATRYYRLQFGEQ